MPDSTSQQTPEPHRAIQQAANSKFTAYSWIAFAGLGLLWLQHIWFLRYSWSSESSYNYGWLVPPLTGLLLFLRSKLPGGRKPLIGGPIRQLTGLLLIACLCSFALARILIEVNPFWRLPLWLGALSLALATLSTIALNSGIPFAKKCVFPILFTLTMVPWPTMIEGTIIDAFTSVVTVVSVELLQIIGHPAEQIGNIIKIGDLSVGVEEACSGIKSLQGLSMMALFIGAFWNLRLTGRFALILWALGLTTLFNLTRSLILSLIIINSGQEVFDEWHDTVGYAAFGLGLISLLLIASHMRSVETPKQETDEKRSYQFHPALAITVLAFACIPYLVTEIWYGEDTREDSGRIDWIVDVQGAAANTLETRPLPIHERITDTLGYDYGHHLAVLDKERNFVSELWFYGFTGESKSKSLGAYGHTPTICMTASGAQLTYRNQPLYVDLGAMEIPFQHAVFKLPDGNTSQVFWCLWDDLHQGETAEVEGRSRFAQFQSAFERQRSFKRKVALLGIPMQDSEAARSKAKDIIRELFLLQKDGKTFRYR